MLKKSEIFSKNLLLNYFLVFLRRQKNRNSCIVCTACFHSRTFLKLTFLLFGMRSFIHAKIHAKKQNWSVYRKWAYLCTVVVAKHREKYCMTKNVQKESRWIWICTCIGCMKCTTLRGVHIRYSTFLRCSLSIWSVYLCHQRACICIAVLVYEQSPLVVCRADRTSSITMQTSNTIITLCSYHSICTHWWSQHFHLFCAYFFQYSMQALLERTHVFEGKEKHTPNFKKGAMNLVWFFSHYLISLN